MVSTMRSSSLSNHKLFCGPLFLVGMPRSGTKMLRGMLEQNPRIRFSPIESEFFPYWVAEWRRIGPTNTTETFDRFYKQCQKLPFFIQNAERGIEIENEEWRSRCKSFEPRDIFEALIRTVLNLSNCDNACIWGDKSPSYIRHVPLLFDQFPNARIIHIIRDVRDCVSSINEAWGKSRLRAAQRWQDDVTKCHNDGQRFSEKFLEVRYEDILANPRSLLTNICAFVGVDFNEQMLKPGTSIEPKMKAKGIDSVLASNVGNYRSNMSPRLIRKIEKIACPSLRRIGYSCSYLGPHARLNRWTMRVLHLSDGVCLLRATVAERGLFGALCFHLSYFWTSGNKSA